MPKFSQVRNRRPVKAAPGGQPPQVDWVADNVLNPKALHVLFDSPVQLNGVPLTFFVDGNTVTGVSQTGPTTLNITLSSTPPAGVVFGLGSYDPAIRTKQGGYAVGKLMSLGSEQTTAAREDAKRVAVADPPHEPPAEQPRVAAGRADPPKAKKRRHRG